MTTVTEQRPTPLALFPDRPVPRLYDRIIEVLRMPHYSRRTDERHRSPPIRKLTIHLHGLSAARIAVLHSPQEDAVAQVQPLDRW